MNTLGLDLSLQSAGVALVPTDWAPGCDWSRVVVRTLGGKLPQDATELQTVKRVARIANAIVDFAKGNDVGHVWLEQYSFTAKDSRAHSLGELGGAVKLRLFDARIPFSVVAASSARAHLGRFSSPRKGPDGRKPKGPKVKEQVHTALHFLGAPWRWSGDELDAFAVANHGLIEGGHGGIVVAREPKAKRRKAA